MDVLRDYWWVGGFLLAEIVSIALMWGSVRHGRAEAKRGVPPAPHPSVEPLRGWRLIELAIILYHFPVVVPTAWMRRDNVAPGMILYGGTPVLYSFTTWCVLRWS